MRIDLHIHSTASDGTLLPAEILERALALKLGAVAITDHDTTAGAREALEKGIPGSLGFLTGIEISAGPPPAYSRPGSFHILGYCIQLEHPALERALADLQRARRNRNPAILTRLAALGIPITMEELLEEAGGGQAGRPHIASCLVAKGVVPSVNAAFERYLGTGKPAYVDKYRIDCVDALRLIIAAGGLPVLAHPGLLSPASDHQMTRMLAELKEMGLRGVEVFYSEHTPEQTRHFAELARRFDLLATGGSDFHGAIQPDIELGSGRGDLNVPYELYENLLRHGK